jgi:hypothetical protein
MLFIDGFANVDRKRARKFNRGKNEFSFKTNLKVIPSVAGPVIHATALGVRNLRIV